MKISVRGADKVERSFDVLGRAVEDFRPLWELLVPELQDMAGAEFKGLGLASGGWAELTPDYAAYKSKVRPGMPLLVFDGDLRSSVTEKGAGGGIIELKPDTLTFGTKLDHAAAHQYGYPPRNLPARPFLVVPDDRLEKWQDLARRWLDDEIEEAFG